MPKCAIAVVLVLICAACSSTTDPIAADLGTDFGLVDLGAGDAGAADLGSDAASTDLGTDAALGDLGTDAAPADLGSDMGEDAAVEVDAGEADADVDAGEPLGLGDPCADTDRVCGAGLSCCYPCGIPGCTTQCAVTCDPSEPACFDGCLLLP